MTRYRILSWGGIPAQVKVFEEGRRPVSVALPEWFVQEIDRVAMRDGLIGADEYLERWSWSADAERPGPAEEVAAALVREIEAEWAPVRRREAGPRRRAGVREMTRTGARDRLRVAVARHRAPDPRRGRRRARRGRDRRAGRARRARRGLRRDPDELEAACRRRRSTRRPAASLVSRYGVGLDNIPVDHATELGILVDERSGLLPAGGVRPRDGAVLACARRVVDVLARDARRARGTSSLARGLPRLAEQTIGLVGFGNIARARSSRRRAGSGCACSPGRRGSTPARRATSS